MVNGGSNFKKDLFFIVGIIGLCKLVRYGDGSEE